MDPPPPPPALPSHHLHLHVRRRRRPPSSSAAPSVASSSTAAAASFRLPPRFRLKRSFLASARRGAAQAPHHRGGAGGTAAAPSTPLPSWKLFDTTTVPSAFDIQHHRHHRHRHRPPHTPNHLAFSNGSAAPLVSARRLAASLWELQDLPFPPRRSTSPSPKHPIHSHHPPPISRNGKPCADSKGNVFGKSATPASAMLDAKAYPNAMSSAQTFTAGTDFWDVPNHLQGFDEQPHESNSHYVAVLQAELNQARSQLQNLLTNDRVRNKEIENLTKKLVKQRVRWREELAESISLAVESIKQELDEERKSRQKLELLHKKVEKDLWECKRRLNKAMEELERERKAHQIMKDVCDELAMEISEDKARVEQLRRESMKVREEVEEERKMLQMAEIWREERVQMKLMEAKLALEEKNSALDKLQSEVEVFRKARRANDERTSENKTHVMGDEGQASHSSSRDSVFQNLAEAFHSRLDHGNYPFNGRRPTESVVCQGRKLGKHYGGGFHGSESEDLDDDFQEEEEEEQEDDDDLHSIELNVESSGNVRWEQRAVIQQQQQHQVDHKRQNIINQRTLEGQSSSPSGKHLELEEQRYEQEMETGRGNAGRHWASLQHPEGREKSIKAWQDNNNNNNESMAHCINPPSPNPSKGFKNGQGQQQLKASSSSSGDDASCSSNEEQPPPFHPLPRQIK